MPIYRGDKQIIKIYRGDREITSVYRGDRQVFSSGERVFLFERGGTDVYKAKFVSEEQGSTMNLSFSATSNFDQFSRKYEIVYKNIFDNYLYYQRISNTVIGKTSVILGGIKTTILSNYDVGKHKITIDKTKLYLDDVFVKDLTIGDTLNTGSQQTIRLRNNSFYEMKIYQDDVLVYHFVPAYRLVGNNKEDYGIAELVNEEFVFNSNLTGKPEYE